MKANMPLIQYPFLATVWTKGRCTVHGCQTLKEAFQISEGYRYYRIERRVGQEMFVVRDEGPESNDRAFWGS